MKNITIGTLFFANTTFQDDELSAKKRLQPSFCSLTPCILMVLALPLHLKIRQDKQEV